MLNRAAQCIRGRSLAVQLQSLLVGGVSLLVPPYRAQDVTEILQAAGLVPLGAVDLTVEVQDLLESGERLRVLTRALSGARRRRGRADRSSARASP